jgi:GT2 family glycosyltransferase
MTNLNIKEKTELKLPSIDCVIIGVNCQKTLENCLRSIRESEYPENRINIYYVDGGSSDRSLEIARSFPGILVKSLELEYPTPGIGRNQGFKEGASPVVQFLDSDTILDPHWLLRGVEALQDPSVGAVQGLRVEMHPEKSVYNWLGSLEWNGPEGEADSFGGDVMIRRNILEQTGGYDEILVGGEDPEFSRRVIRSGWKILQLGTTMTRHDLAMTQISQYWKRSYRSGYGFAAVRGREARLGSTFWRRQIYKISIRGGGFLLTTLFGMALMLFRIPLLTGIGILSLAAGTAALLRPRIFLVDKFKTQHSLTTREARIYAWHCSLAVIPQFLGVFRYYLGKSFNRPLRNRRLSLATAVTDK